MLASVPSWSRQPLKRIDAPPCREIRSGTVRSAHCRCWWRRVGAPTPTFSSERSIAMMRWAPAMRAPTCRTGRRRRDDHPTTSPGRTPAVLTRAHPVCTAHPNMASIDHRTEGQPSPSRSGRPPHLQSNRHEGGRDLTVASSVLRPPPIRAPRLRPLRPRWTRLASGVHSCGTCRMAITNTTWSPLLSLRRRGPYTRPDLRLVTETPAKSRATVVDGERSGSGNALRQHEL